MRRLNLPRPGSASSAGGYAAHSKISAIHEQIRNIKYANDGGASSVSGSLSRIGPPTVQLTIAAIWLTEG